MGTNEHGLTIGNTAVFTKVPYQTGPGLTGMDFLRLALERANNSREALDVITGLLEAFGQGGNCGFRKSLHYHNSYILADPREAWILETAGKHWVAEKVKDVRASSNTLTITTEYDLISPDTIDYAKKQGWHKAGKAFDFKQSFGGRGAYPSFLYTFFSRADERQNRLAHLLTENKGKISVAKVMEMLRDHGCDKKLDYNPGEGYIGNTVCMHAGFGPIRTDQTTGSMVSHLTTENPTHWLTGTSAPCTSVFKPLWFDTGVPDIGPAPTGQYNQSTLWWQHENLHREILRDFSYRLSLFEAGRDELEAEFIERVESLRMASHKKRKEFSKEAFRRSLELTKTGIEKMKNESLRANNPFLYRAAWKTNSREARLYESDEKGYTSFPG